MFFSSYTSLFYNLFFYNFLKIQDAEQFHSHENKSDLYFVLSVLETQVILNLWGFERICLWKFCNSASVGKMRGLEIVLFLGTNLSLLILRDQNPICWIHWVFSFSGQVERGWMIELLYNLFFFIYPAHCYSDTFLINNCFSHVASKNLFSQRQEHSRTWAITTGVVHKHGPWRETKDFRVANAPPARNIQTPNHGTEPRWPRKELTCVPG